MKTASAACVAAIAVSAASGAWGAEGMWTLDHPPLERMRHELGWAPDAAWRAKAMHASVRLGNGCSASFVSFTRFGGAFARATGAEPFALPPSWLAARDRLDPALPLDLVTMNDIIGGNSGSPLLDRDRALVELAFDGNIHSIGGAFFYEGQRNRTVAVDSAAILAALERIYAASALANEIRGR